MSEVSTELQPPTCAACGRPHLPTRWEREYLCPSCGKPLKAGNPARRSRRATPLWVVAGAAGVVLLLGSGLRLGADLARRSPQVNAIPVSRPTDGPPQVELPPNFEARLIQKIELLREDLRLEPANAGLLQRLAETHLLFAMYQRENGKQDFGQGALQRARRAIARLEALDPPQAGELLYQCDNFTRLSWGAPRALGGFVERFPRSPSGLGEWGTGRSPGGEPRRPGLNLEGSTSGDSGRGLVAPPVSPFPVAAPYGPGLPGSEGPRNPLLTPPGTPSAPPLPPNGLRPEAPPDALVFRKPVNAGSVEAEKERLIRQIPFREELVKSAPAAIGPVLDLAKLYETLAATERRAAATPAGSIGEKEERWLRRALDVYVKAAEASPLRSNRATLLDFAADLHGRLHEWDKQYALLRRALDDVPTSPRLWRKFQSVCLLTGRREENLEARRQYQNWSFPTLVFRDL